MGESRIIPQAPYRRRLELHILSEIPTTLGLVLWQDLRHVRDWAEAAAAEREALFPRAVPPWVAAKRAEARAHAPELGDALAAFQALLADPLASDPRRVAEASVAVAQWAETLRHTETAVQFADAAACVSRSDPRLANLAGRIARNAADFARAEAWFERAVMLAREQRNTVELTRAHLGSGILCKELRRVRSARRHFERAANLARKAGFEWLAAEAQHDLFAYLLVRGHYARAAEHARKAFALYPKHNRRLPFFAADFALLLVCQRQFSAAARLLKPILRLVTEPGPRSVLLALTMRVRAELGSADEAKLVKSRLLRLVEKHGEWEAVVRWHIGEAERALGRWDEAASSARTAVRLAVARRDRETARLARKLLDDIARRRSSPPHAERTDPWAAAFIHALIQRLVEWSPSRAAREPKTLTRSQWAA